MATETELKKQLKSLKSWVNNFTPTKIEVDPIYETRSVTIGDVGSKSFYIDHTQNINISGYVQGGESRISYWIGSTQTDTYWAEAKIRADSSGSSVWNKRAKEHKKSINEKVELLKGKHSLIFEAERGDKFRGKMKVTFKRRNREKEKEKEEELKKQRQEDLQKLEQKKQQIKELEKELNVKAKTINTEEGQKIQLVEGSFITEGNNLYYIGGVLLLVILYFVFWR